MILRIRCLLMLVEYTGVEDRADALIEQPLHMPVRKLRGIALRFGGDRLHAKLVNFAA